MNFLKFIGVLLLCWAIVLAVGGVSIMTVYRQPDLGAAVAASGIAFLCFGGAAYMKGDQYT